MSPSALMGGLTARGVTFSVREGRLVVNAPRGVLTPEDKAALAVHKAEVLALLSEPCPPVRPADPGAVSDAAEPDPAQFDRLSRSRRTAWGTVAWSDPAAPGLEMFGPPSDSEPRTGETDVPGPQRRSRGL